MKFLTSSRLDRASFAAVVSMCLAGGVAGLRGADAPLTLAVAGRANANVSLAAKGAFVAAVWSASVAKGATDIYAGFSVDGGTRFSSPVRVNSTAGEASVNGEQPPRDGGRTFAPPVRASEDKWELEGCPDDGPAMAIDAQGAAHVVWPTLVTERGAQTIGLFQATSSDGKRFSPRLRVPTEGQPHHPQMVIASNGSLALAWDELIGGKRRVVFARSSKGIDGGVSLVRQILSTGEPAVYPVMAATPDGVLTAWTSGAPETSVIRVERR